MSLSIPGIGSTGPYPLGSPLYKGGSSGYVPQLSVAPQQQQGGGGFMAPQPASSSLGSSSAGGGTAPLATPTKPTTPTYKPSAPSGGGTVTTQADIQKRITDANSFNQQNRYAEQRAAEAQSAWDFAPNLQAAIANQNTGVYSRHGSGNMMESLYGNYATYRNYM